MLVQRKLKSQKIIAKNSAAQSATLIPNRQKQRSQRPDTAGPCPPGQCSPLSSSPHSSSPHSSSPNPSARGSITLAKSTSQSTGQSERRQKTSDAIAMYVSLSDPALSAQRDLQALPDLPTHVVRLSTESLQFNHTEQLDPAQRVWLTLRLDQRDVNVTAEVTTCEKKKDHHGKLRFDTQLRFIDTTRDFQSMVQTHIADVIATVYKNRLEYTYVPGELAHPVT